MANNNCSNNSSNACSNCEGCSEILSSDCMLYVGTGISGLSYPENPTVSQIIYALGTLVISLQAELDALVPS